MKKYRVWVNWEVSTAIEVEADSETEARQIAKDINGLPPGGEYVQDSFMILEVEEVKSEDK